MDFIYVGKIVNTHALKGEVRILSSFEYKNLVFKKDFPIYIGENYEKHLIQTYRKHKQYDMLSFQDINDVEVASFYKGNAVYIKRDSIHINGYFMEDLLNLSVYDKKKYIGKVIMVEESKAHKILLLDSKIRIPYVDVYIKEICLEEKKIEVELIEGFLYEN